MRALALPLLLLATGCDVVFGLSGEERPCAPAAFSSTPQPITPASQFSISEDLSRVVVDNIIGGAFEVRLDAGMPTGTPLAVDLGLYPPQAFALSPEGDDLQFSGALEPPLLETAHRRDDGTWALEGSVPKGVFTGTPTARRYGSPRRLVRLREGDAPGVQEYIETDAGTWITVGRPMTIPGTFAPNMTANGLTAVFSIDDPSAPAVFEVTRASLDDVFGAPHLVLAGDYHSPQLATACDALFVVDQAPTTMNQPALLERIDP